MSFTVEYRLRDWSDWSTEVQHLPIDDQIAHTNPINDLFPDPEHGLSYAPPQPTPASPTHSPSAHPTTDKKNVASPPKPFQHLFWGSPGTKAQPAMQDPLLHNYPIDLPRDVVSAYAHVMSHPTTLSPSAFPARPSPHAPPRAFRAVPLAPATNWSPPDPWQEPQYHVRGPFSQAPFLKYHFPNATEAPPPAPPAPRAAIEAPPPPARYYTEYVNNVNEPRKLITAAPEPPAPSPPAKHAKADKADPWTFSGKASKSSPFPAADHWQNPAGAAPWASTAPARKENLWAAPAAVSTHANAFWPATADTGKSDMKTGWGAPPKAAPPAPAFWAPQASAKTDQGHVWSPAPPAATKAQSKAEREKEKARRAHADAVNQMDRGDPNGGAFYHGGPYDAPRTPYERQTHGRTASQGSAGVRFDAGPSAHYTPRQRPPSPTAQLDRFVAQVSQARHPAAFADLYERTASPPGAKGQKKKEQNQGKGKKGDVGLFGAPTFPASRFEQGAVSAAARHRARVEDEKDDDDMPELVPAQPHATSFWSGGSDVSRSTVQGHGFGQPQGKKGQYPGFR